MDWLSHVDALVSAVGPLVWGFLQKRRAKAAAAAAAAAEAARAALEHRLDAQGRLGERFAEALARGDLAEMRALEAERMRRGL